jgi:hypothetical protein
MCPAGKITRSFNETSQRPLYIRTALPKVYQKVRR